MFYDDGDDDRDTSASSLTSLSYARSVALAISAVHPTVPASRKPSDNLSTGNKLRNVKMKLLTGVDKST